MLSRNVAILALTLSVLVIAAYIGLGYFTFPQVDDFDEALWPNTLGYWGTLKYAYITFSGRFAQVITFSVINTTGIFPYYVHVYVMSAILLFVVALAAFLKRRLYGRLTALIAIDIAYLFITLPDIVKREAFYLEAFSILYLLSFSLCLLALAYIDSWKPGHGRIGLALWFAAFFFIGGFSEPLSVVILLFLSTYLALHFRRRQQPLYDRVLAAAAATAIAFVIVIIAPGNFVRLGEHPNLWVVIKATCERLYLYAIPFIGKVAFYIILKTCLAADPKPLPRRFWEPSFWPYVGVTMVGCVLSFFLVLYGNHGGEMPGRNFLLPLALLYIAALWLPDYLAYAVKPMLKTIPPKGKKVALAIVGLVIVWNAHSELERLISSYDQAVVQREIAFYQIGKAYEAQQRGDKTLKVEPIPNQDSLIYINTPSGDPGYWVNGAYERYFHIEQISTY